MFIRPGGPQLSEEQARELDDRYLGSQPFHYFRARLWSLVSELQPPATAAASELGAAVARRLGWPPEMAEDVLTAPSPARELQVAVDALSLRHHAAEALLSLYHA